MHSIYDCIVGVPMSDVSSFSTLFKEVNVRLEQLLFDPNNPRLFGIPQKNGWRESVPSNIVSQASTQNRVYQELQSYADVTTIKDSILQVGYVPIDRIVIRPLNKKDRYIVIEGNRRLAAMKLIQDEIERGEEKLPSGLLDQLNSVPALVYLGSAEDFERHRYTLQGIRHIGGIRGWGPYERGLAVQTLRAAGKNPKEIKKALLLRSVIKVNRVLRAMSALEQMRKDEEYGEFATPDHYTHMEEAITRTKIKEWLDWNETTMQFENLDRFREFLSWIVGPDEIKIRQSIQIRLLPYILESEDALEFLRTPEVTIQEAYAYTQRKTPAININFYKKSLEEIVGVLKTLPAGLLKDPQSYELLLSIQELIGMRIQEAKALSQLSESAE